MKMNINPLNEFDLLILDGATGTELERNGVKIDLPLWSTTALLNDEGRNILRKIHADYISAGADIITANTFRTNIRTLSKVGLESKSKSFTLSAVDEVRRTIDIVKPDRNVFIAGSVAPVEDCYSPELVPTCQELISEHQRHIDYLYAAGVDILLIETMNTIREARIALEYAKQTGLPVFISFVCKDAEHLCSGEKLCDTVSTVAALYPDVIMVNCATVEIITLNLQILKKSFTGRIGAYANILMNQKNKNSGFAFSQSPAQYTETVNQWILDYHLYLVGGCCGTTPEHIHNLSENINAT
jgi:S-methylmethionine-dependent homocysteine/selenocysteine methylase